MSEPQPPPRRPDPSGQPLVSFGDAQTGDVTFGDVAGGDIHKTTIINPTPLSPAERQAQRNRVALLSLVRRFWVEGVLHESLHRWVRIELGMQARPDAVDHPWRNIVRLPGQAAQPLAPGQPIGAVFAQAGGRLLILGAPGGGKTTTLLTLAEQLLDAAEADDSLPIPVVFQLSTWAVQKPTLADWLETELKDRYKVPPKVGQAWVAAGEILPLLDGLDEVGPGDAERAACVQAINAYLGEAGAHAAVCSRTAEYAQLGARLSLEAAIEVQPLDRAQVDGYLAEFGASLAGLRAAVADDATLRDLAASPLLLSVMALAYQDTPADDLVGQGREAAYRRLWDDYVQNRMALKRADATTDPAQLRAWLIWLARGMQAHGQQAFYIEYLQPSWLNMKTQRLLFRLLSFLVLGLVLAPLGLLVFGIGSAVIFSLFRNAEFGTFNSLASSLLFGTGGALAISLFISLSDIKLAENLVWSLWDALSWQHIYRNLKFGLLGGLVFGLAVGLMMNPVSGLLGGVVGFLVIGLIFGSISNMLQVNEITIRIHPNEGVRRSWQNMLIGGLAFSLGGGLVFCLILSLRGSYAFSLVGNQSIALIYALIFGFVIGMLRYGGAAVIKHYILRLLLRFRCHTPWNFAAALDEAVSRTLMTRVGGGYRFYHRLLQEHFAEREVSDLPIAPILGPQQGDRAAGLRAQG